MKPLILAATVSMLAGAAFAQTPAATTGASAPTTASNAAVNTSNTNAAQPSRGSNSFTMGEAQGRIAKQGFSDVSDLQKDADGIWRGHAQKGGQQVSVWLDYKGDVGQN